jgi:iron complex transport system substrate-binding protein
MIALVLASALTMSPASAGASARPDAMDGGARTSIRWLGPPAPAHPLRVVSLAPSLTDTVVALGHARALVGVTRYDDAPEVAKVKRVGGFLDPSVEAILGLKADLVLWQTDGNAAQAIRQIAALGIPVMAIPVITVADTLEMARAVGAALGDPASGEALAKRLSDALAAMRARSATLPKTRVLFLIGREPLVVAGPGSYPDELLRAVGAINVAESERPWPVYPLEKVLAAHPELIIDAAILEPADGALKLSVVPAVRAGHYRRLANDATLRPGPKLAEALEVLFTLVHPGAPAR